MIAREFVLWRVIMLRRIFIAVFVCSAAMILSCSAQRTASDTVTAENDRFLTGNASSNDEVFRVLIMSDTYKVNQVNAPATIMRVDDKSGDQFMCEDLAKCDKINEAREAVYTVSLYPDNGRIYQIRPKRLANLIEIDHLIVQDLQRWNVAHPEGKRKEIKPLKFEVHYRVVLRKKMTDEAILQEKRDIIKDRN